MRPTAGKLEYRMAFIISAKQQYSGKWSQKMIKRSAAVFTLIPLVSACAVTMTEPEAASPTRSIPEEVIAIAGPNQDIMSAFLRPDDNFRIDKQMQRQRRLRCALKQQSVHWEHSLPSLQLFLLYILIRSFFILFSLSVVYTIWTIQIWLRYQSRNSAYIPRSILRFGRH